MSGRLPRGVKRLLGRRAPAPLQLTLPDAVVEVQRDGPAPLERTRSPGGELRVGIVIPSFRRGSGGHSTLANLVRGLEARGHACSLWVEDDQRRHAGVPDAELDRQFKEFFGPLGAPVRATFADWTGADVAVATGWQTVHRVLTLPGAAARAYLVQDHEPEFFATSAERLWAEDGYRRGLHCICASPWLAELVAERYGASASHFDLGVDHAIYRTGAGDRRDDLVVFYARAVTARRAVPLGLLALKELQRRRPAVEIVLFGESRPVEAGFPHRDVGVLPPDRLASLYREATVGMVLSMTNPSLIPTEMLACGLPCLDMASASMLATFGADGPVALEPADPLALAGRLEALLDDPAQRARRARAGIELVRARTWARAAEQVEEGLRAAVRAAA